MKNFELLQRTAQRMFYSDYADLPDSKKKSSKAIYRHLLKWQRKLQMIKS